MAGVDREREREGGREGKSVQLGIMEMERGGRTKGGHLILLSISQLTTHVSASQRSTWGRRATTRVERIGRAKSGLNHSAL